MLEVRPVEVIYLPKFLHDAADLFDIQSDLLHSTGVKAHPVLTETVTE